MTLAKKAFNATRWTTLSNVFRAVLQLAQIALLARFLPPQDYGLMAMVTVVLSYAALFSDMGLGAAFIQQQYITQNERSSLFWLSVVIGLLLMLTVMACSPLAAFYFKEPQLISLLMLASTNFLVTPLGQQLRVDAEKALNFKSIAVIEISGALVGLIVAVVSAWQGLGVYSLVFSAITSAWVSMLLSWLLLAKGWRPSCRLNWNDVRRFARFGGLMVVNNLINHINSTIDIVLGGQLLGATSLGLYSVPRNLTLQVQFMVNPIFTRVGFPLIASIQYDKERVKLVYLKTMRMTASVNAPIYIAMIFFAPEIVAVMLGQQWLNAVELLRVLALWGLLRSFGNPVGSLLFGLGHVHWSTLWNAGVMFIIPPVVWLGSKWGAIGMAYAMVALMAGMFVPAWKLLVKPSCGARLKEYFATVAVPIFCAFLSGIFASYVANFFDINIARLSIGLIVGMTSYTALSFLINKEFTDGLVNVLNLKNFGVFLSGQRCKL